MKLPMELRSKLRRQWQQADLRESRLLNDTCWPLLLPIGKPKASQIKQTSANLRAHLQHWRNEKIGQVEWQSIKYQSASTIVDMPLVWCIQNNKEWVAACQDKTVSSEFEFLSNVLMRVEAMFHVLLVRQRSVWRNASPQQVVQCCELAMQLQEGCAQGRPLRALSINNIDSKFIENNRTLLIKLLNIRFNQALENISLEVFLNAASENDHWLLVVPLSKGLLPFQQQRVKATELAKTKLPCSHIIIIENERCHYQLPQLKNTIAILGAGLNLNWLSNAHFNTCHIAYWGDIDSWGLRMLSIARNLQPQLTALMMDDETFENNKKSAVKELETAGQKTPEYLNADEENLYQKLLQLEKGRLEQEFIDKLVVEKFVAEWVEGGV
ncbi:FIG005429: hypothetical protein [hydrothermal vent metagenome]|uniref:Wadjet protein JetD C-terminal domain-containing protein n=1 Tax=hydrothermal vent metagenome TaxID=652676 RepID=A0A3B0WX54_9ZZZZ